MHGRVVLIGDAAHAMLPHQGAGAGQGLEDAYFLARLLGDTQADAGNLAELLEAYDDLRRPRACRVQQTSWETGELYELRDPVVGANEQLLGENLATRFDWLWNTTSTLTWPRPVRGWVGSMVAGVRYVKGDNVDTDRGFDGK